MGHHDLTEQPLICYSAEDQLPARGTGTCACLFSIPLPVYCHQRSLVVGAASEIGGQRAVGASGHSCLALLPVE